MSYPPAFHRIPIFVFIVPAVMLIVALGAMPWGYYQIMRLVVAVAFTWIAAAMYANERTAIGIVFAVLALAYNPFIPLRLGRATWEVINIVTLFTLIVASGRRSC